MYATFCQLLPVISGFHCFFTVLANFCHRKNPTLSANVTFLYRFRYKFIQVTACEKLTYYQLLSYCIAKPTRVQFWCPTVYILNVIVYRCLNVFCRAAMAIAFSSSGDAVMTREIACSCSSYWSFTDTASEFDVMSTAQWINEHQFRKVCSLLQ